MVWGGADLAEEKLAAPPSEHALQSADLLEKDRPDYTTEGKSSTIDEESRGSAQKPSHRP